MRIDKQIEASKRNGALSKGPLSPEGKARSTQSARRHGFLSKMVITGAESEEGLKDIVNEHLRRFGYLDGVEFGMIEEMAVAYWRMRRAWFVEKEWLDQHVSANSHQRGITTIATAF